MLFRQTAPGSAHLWEGTGSAPRSISLDFSFISALRWCAEHRALLATAVPRGGRVPEVRSGERGDLRLFRLAASASGFEQVSRGYLHDPVCLRGGRFAVHRGSAVCVLSPKGVVERDVHRMRFGWGPPSVAASPDGSHLAFVRWRGNDRLLCTASADAGEAVVHPGPVTSFAWRGPRTLLATTARGLRMLDVDSGALTSFRPRWRAELAAAPEVSEETAALLRLPPPQVAVTQGSVFAAGDVVWFVADVYPWDGRPGLHGVVRLGPDGAATTAIEVPKGSRVESFSVLPDGTLVAHVADFEDLTIVRRRVVACGPSQAAVNEGWRPLPDCHVPEFGFHVLPE
jgi:hypothetical protein